jgi:hypothetical protein
MNLVLLGMQQSRTASAAGIIHGMIARLKHGRSFQKHTGCRRDDYLEADLRNGHNVLPYAGGSTTELSATDARLEALSNDGQYIGIGRHIGH